MPIRSQITKVNISALIKPSIIKEHLVLQVEQILLMLNARSTVINHQ